MAPPRKSTDIKQLSRRVLVTIDRDMTSKTPRVVWQHEIPILEAIHGEGKVAVVEAATLDEGYSAKPSPDMLVHNKRQDAVAPPSRTVGIGHVFIGDPRAEFDRLAGVYGWHPEVKETMVENVFGRFALGRFAMLLGEPDLEDLPDEQLRDLVRAYGGAPADANFKATDEERRAIAAEVARFNALAGDELLKLARDTGVTLR
jgi:hypothetical protein